MGRRAQRVLVLLLAGGVLAGCGSNGSPTTKPATGTGTGEKVPRELTRAREARSCASLASDQGCAYYDRLEGWFQDGTLAAKDAPGAVALVENGCILCHRYRDIGTQMIGAPNLTHAGATNDESTIARVIVCPTCVTPDSAMPAFKTLPKRTVDELAAFLASQR